VGASHRASRPAQNTPGESPHHQGFVECPRAHAACTADRFVDGRGARQGIGSDFIAWRELRRVVQFIGREISRSSAIFTPDAGPALQVAGQRTSRRAVGDFGQ